MKRDKSKSGGIIYVMLHFPLICFCKIGITGRTAKKRARDLDRAVLGFPFPIFAVPLPWAYEVEQWLHSILRPLSARFYSGDGASEWFWLPAVLFAIPALAVLFVLFLGVVGGGILLILYWIVNC